GRPGTAAHARSRKAACSAGSSFSRASMKSDCSFTGPLPHPAVSGCHKFMRRRMRNCARKPRTKTWRLRGFDLRVGAVAEFFPEPRTGVRPDLVGLARRDAERRGGVGVAQAAEVAQL